MIFYKKLKTIKAIIFIVLMVLSSIAKSQKIDTLQVSNHIAVYIHADQHLHIDLDTSLFYHVFSDELTVKLLAKKSFNTSSALLKIGKSNIDYKPIIFEFDSSDQIQMYHDLSNHKDHLLESKNEEVIEEKKVELPKKEFKTEFVPKNSEVQKSEIDNDIYESNLTIRCKQHSDIISILPDNDSIIQNIINESGNKMWLTNNKISRLHLYDHRDTDIGEIEHNIMLVVQAMRNDSRAAYLKILIRNQSSTDYKIDSIAIQLLGKKKDPIIPISVINAHVINEVYSHTEGIIVFAIPSYLRFYEDYDLEFKVYEVKGVRHRSLKIPMKRWAREEMLD